jgi:hypothetical protein
MLAVNSSICCRIGVVSLEWLLAVITVLFPGLAMVEHFGGE